MEGGIDVIINASLYVVLFILLYRKNRQIGPVEILMALYALVAICAVNLFYIDKNRWDLHLGYFLYLFLSVTVYFLGVSNDKVLVLHSNPITNYSFYKKVSILYVLLALFSCVFYIPQVIYILQNPEWALLYEDSHEMTNTSITIKLANAFFHLRYLGVVLFFSMLSHKKSSKLLKILLGIGASLPVFLVTMLNASRGGLIILVASLIMTYFMFKPILASNIKKTIKRSAIFIVPVFILYFIVVSISRFSDDLATGYSSTNEAFWDYIGHSMLYFNNGVMDCITSYGHGSYMFAMHDNSIRGTNFGTKFITFVGCLYLDFGAIGTLMIGLLISLLLKKICHRRLGVPELFLILNYMMFLFYGVFVTASGYGFQWVEILIIYLGLKFFEIQWK